MNYGKAIRAFRLKTKVPQRVLASCVGITQPYLSLIENSKKVPSMEVLERISTELGIPLPILMLDTLSVDNVPIQKRDAFIALKPAIDNLLTFFYTQLELEQNQ